MNADSPGCRRRLLDDEVGLVVEVFRMLADATRVQILWALVDRELSVNDLADRVGKPAPSVSQHLSKLRMARLVRTRREGTQVIYRLENEHVQQLVTDAVFNAEHAGPGIPGHHRATAGLRELHPHNAVEPAASSASSLNHAVVERHSVEEGR
ncbi:transcriptional regulator [Rhodococcus sp. 1163]|uniref:ArsR/SmtB family transcription factor n=1 Tax=unclassified Rhodococcus (in: high G+C Gram-positive bacteria) TaxID=192944 RepID=UPI000A06E48C|nr:metalloregulator ArsR/SmtB family transcription factor [Rhodococcus sp. 1163]ORI17029.1 transcriptional regulator [Rhodococcus sp. 1163]